jgi:hypothetical protein
MSTASEIASQTTSQLPHVPKSAKGWIGLVIALFLLILAFVIVERKKPGFFAGLVGKVPGVNKGLSRLAAIVVGLGALLASGAAHAAEAFGSATAAHPAGAVAAILLALLTGALIFGERFRSSQWGRQAGAVRMNGVRRQIVPHFVSAGGSAKVVTTAPGGDVEFVVKKLPQRDGGFFWNAMQTVVSAVVTVTKPSAGGSDIPREALYKILRAYSIIGEGKLGTIADSSRTSGARLGLIDSRISNGYAPRPLSATVLDADASNVKYLVRWVLPFAMGCNTKPHHFAPLCSLYEDALVHLYFAANNVIDGDSTGAVVGANIYVTVRTDCEAFQECMLHVPAKWGLYKPIGSGTASVDLLLRQMGYPDHLNGVEVGMGLAALYLMCDVDALAGGFTLDELTQWQAKFLGVGEVTQFPEHYVEEFVDSISDAAVNERDMNAAVTATAEPEQLRRFPYMPTGTITWGQAAGQSSVVGSPLASTGILFPALMPPRQMELSKVDGVRGDRVITPGFSSEKSNVEFKVGTLEVGRFTDDFKKDALDMIFGRGARAIYSWEKNPSRKNPGEVDTKKGMWLPSYAVKNTGAGARK